jgi:hypothetical protein
MRNNLWIAGILLLTFTSILFRLVTLSQKETHTIWCGFLFAIGFGRDSNLLNAARMSAAGEG